MVASWIDSSSEQPRALGCWYNVLDETQTNGCRKISSNIALAILSKGHRVVKHRARLAMVLRRKTGVRELRSMDHSSQRLILARRLIRTRTFPCVTKHAFLQGYSQSTYDHTPTAAATINPQGAPTSKQTNIIDYNSTHYPILVHTHTHTIGLPRCHPSRAAHAPPRSP